MKKWKLILFTIIFLTAGVVRLYKFSNPIADWHSWRQVDTSAVSRNFVQQGFDLLHPRFEDISNVPSGLDNPKGYRFVEFPLYNVLQAGGYVLFPKFSLEEWGRIVTIIASLFSLLFIFLLVKKYAGDKAALFAAGFFAFDPFVVYYSRVVLPDPSMAVATLACIYFFDKFVENFPKQKMWMMHFLLALLAGIAALLLKPFAAFFFLPLAVIVWNKWQWKLLLQPLLWIFVILLPLPLAWWRVWMGQFPAGIPASSWLFNAGNIRFTGAYFYWIFADRLGRLILGYWGLIIFALGLLTKKSRLFFVSFLIASLAYVVVIARGNVQHDYYQILILPTIALFFGLGADFLLSLSNEITSKWVAGSLLTVSIIFSFMFGWYFVRDYYDTNTSLVVAGEAVDRLTPKNAKILTFMNGDTTFLYYTNRQGWASLEKSLPEMVQMGADYIAIPNPTQSDLNGFGKQYAVVAANSQYLIVNLHKPTATNK